MRWEQVYLAGTGVWLADRTNAAAAVAAGAYDAGEHAVNQIHSVSSAAAGGPDDLSAPEMAVRAARTALRRSGPAAERITNVFHSYLWFQGAELWPSAAYVAQHAVGSAVPAFDLLQQCNAGLAGVELAARQLQGGGSDRAGGGEAVLLTTADRFAAPAFDRWRAERGMVYGDGGTALVLSSSPAGATGRLLATATRVDNSLEGLARGAGFRSGPEREPRPVDLGARAEEYFRAQRNMRAATLRTAEVAAESIRVALADSGTPMDRIDRVVLNATGQQRLRWQLEHQLGIEEEFSNWEFCREVGHLGAGDHFAGLNELLETGEVGEGDRVLLVGGGTGYSCTSAVVEITDTSGGCA
ncbi:ketoacyl-ACP synthase III family protein [Streptomyces sp. NBC_00536]|uniref:ketoacyl-ACP synthase III family protein n=1 Tax=Streptomyces sp. NBC_00536 TaxID=2975769 RepID=UPI002E807097|nr:ketoacyl-ACP synthase III family protein [Streptomyces sp. NBC_00536]WUC82373.1 ketoacyl-ACP synthase III family protein [Streptomyces sp. NBC_00536]